MRIRLGTVRRLIREALREQTWMPGRYFPAAEPLSGEDADRINSKTGEVETFELELDEVDLDPSNNPGRPDDPYEYLGMHPDPKAAMAPPGAPDLGVGGGGDAGGADSSTDAPVGGGDSPDDAPVDDEAP